MKTKDILFVLLLGTVWGLFEVILGGTLYALNVPHASVPLWIVAFAVLTFAREYRPVVGVATLLAVVAICYKGLGMLVSWNQPIYICHFMGILLLGVAYDVGRLVWRDKYDPLFAVSATYLGHALFAVLMTWVFRYSFWAQAGMAKVLNHVLITGTLAAVGAAIVVPVCARWARMLKARQFWPFAVRRPRFATGILTLVVVGLWTLGVGLYRFTALGG